MSRVGARREREGVVPRARGRSLPALLYAGATASAKSWFGVRAYLVCRAGFAGRDTPLAQAIERYNSLSGPDPRCISGRPARQRAALRGRPPDHTPSGRPRRAPEVVEFPSTSARTSATRSFTCSRVSAASSRSLSTAARQPQTSPFAMGRTAAPAAGRMTGAPTAAPRPISRPPPHPLVAVSSRLMLLSSLSLPSRKIHIGLVAPTERGLV